MAFLSPEFISLFHFLRPLCLLGLIPAVLFFLLLQTLHSHQSSWYKAIEPALLPFLLDKTLTPKQSQPLYGLLLIWILSIIAVAGPVWEQLPVPVQEREDALVVVMDLSLSMYANDVFPNRIVRAQRKLVDILNTRADEGQTALVVYAGDAHAVIPLTDDVETINNMVSSLNPNIMPAMGSRPATGVRLAVQLLENAAVLQAQILLITDGINRSDIPVIKNIITASNHRLSVLGIGTENGAPIPMEEGGFLRDRQNAIVIPKLERDILQELASATRGRYADAVLTDEDINYLLRQNIFEENENLVDSDREFDNWYETGPWLLLLVLPFAALAFRQGWLLGPCLVAILLPHKQAYAWEWHDLWVTKDQQASQVFVAEDYQQAVELFRDDAWRAAANYKIESYEQVLEDLALLQDADSHYNRGNALARLNRFEEAIAAYDETLAQIPDHEDALHNRQILTELLEQQENQQPQDQGSENDQQQEQEGDEESEQNQQDQQNQEQQDDSEQQSDEQGESEQQEQQSDQEQDQSDEQGQSDEEQAQSSEGEQPDTEEEQAMQQWLQRISDDPGELLRNKFADQTRRRMVEQLLNPNLAEQESETQIW